MDGMPCMRCEQEIPEKTPYWSVSVQQEVLDGDEVEVFEATCYLILCDRCAAGMDFDRISVPEKAGA